MGKIQSIDAIILLSRRITHYALVYWDKFKKTIWNREYWKKRIVKIIIYL